MQSPCGGERKAVECLVKMIAPHLLRGHPSLVEERNGVWAHSGHSFELSARVVCSQHLTPHLCDAFGEEDLLHHTHVRSTLLHGASEYPHICVQNPFTLR